ncbi:MAG: GntR family transcriptional regulator [Fimbriimonas sp.]|nr:GntR family transcriptional regulator [Fimbriimonas sp.]
MRIIVSPKDGVPIYLQIVQQVRRLVASGELASGDELPSIRVLADSLVVNPNTVARAYRELEMAGIVSTSRGLGTYVNEASQSTAHAERRAVIIDRVDSLILESLQLGIPFGELVELVRERHASFETGDEAGVSCG